MLATSLQLWRHSGTARVPQATHKPGGCGEISSLSRGAVSQFPANQMTSAGQTMKIKRLPEALLLMGGLVSQSLAWGVAPTSEELSLARQWAAANFQASRSRTTAQRAPLNEPRAGHIQGCGGQTRSAPASATQPHCPAPPRFASCYQSSQWCERGLSPGRGPPLGLPRCH